MNSSSNAEDSASSSREKPKSTELLLTIKGQSAHTEKRVTCCDRSSMKSTYSINCSGGFYVLIRIALASVAAKWKFTPLALEASEFMAQESTDAFWRFIEQMVGKNYANFADLNQMMLYGGILSSAEQTLQVSRMSSKIKLLKFALSLRAFSPKIEMFHQLALDAPAPSCDLFYEVGGRATCFWPEAKKLLDEGVQEKPMLYSQDHVFPASGPNLNQTVILYGDFMSSSFRDVHDALSRMARNGEIRYVLRHYVRARPEGSVKLSGYGVELALKKTEYKAVDDSEVKAGESSKQESEEAQDEEIEGFDFKTLRKLNPDLSQGLSQFRNHLQETTNEMRPMKIWQLQDLSFQAAARVLASPKEDQLRVLKDISQNFPLRARSLIKQQVPDELREEILRNQRHSFLNIDLEAGGNALFVNGIPIEMETTDVYTILEILRSENKIMDGLAKLDIKDDKMKSFLHLDIKTTTDTNLLDIRDSSIVWLNDVEKDDKYKQWPTNIRELLRPAFPGTIRKLRRNLCHLVLVVDPTTREMNHLVSTAEALWANSIPIRIGIVFVISDSKEVDGRTDAGVGLLRAYNFARNELSDAEAFSFLAAIYKSLGKEESLTAEHVVQRMKKKFPGEDMEELLGIKSDYDDYRKLGKAFYDRSGLHGDVHVLVNGELMTNAELDEDLFEEAVIEKLFEATRYLQRSLYMGETDGSGNLLDFFMARPEVVPRFNDIVLKEKARFINFEGTPSEEATYWSPLYFEMLTSGEKTTTIAKYIRPCYISKSETKNSRPVTVWVVTDVGTPDGRKLVYNAYKHAKSSSHTRVAIIHNPTDPQDYQNVLTKAIESTLVTQQINNARNFIIKLMKEPNAAEILTGEKKVSEFYVGGMDEERFEKVFHDSAETSLAHVGVHSVWARTVLNLQPGQNAVLANGRIIGPIDSATEFLPDDFLLLENVVYSSAAQKIQKALQEVELLTDDGAEDSDLIMKLTALLSTQSSLGTERQNFPHAASEHSVVKVESSDEDVPSFEVIAVVDPASEESQQIIPLIMVLHEVVNADIKVFMNCREKLSDMPVKRFYRYVLEPELKFMLTNELAAGPLAKFNDMPKNALLTLTLFAPEGWMVEPVRAIYDLDNIKLEEVQSSKVKAEYELEFMLLEGHAIDMMTGSRPGGLQFTLGTKSNPLTVDTIVMSNLGYFQLKANPGAWFLNLREGRSKDIYDITGHSGTDSAIGSTNVTILMDSFKSKTIGVRVSKKPDKMNLNLLDEEKKANTDESAGIWDSIAKTFTGGSKSETSGDTNNNTDVLNIFTLASGHLYERLMRIMIVSLLRNTNAKVKFWILKNYLSPHFKNFIPHMAKQYGFEYELVQYKWPRWLRQQKEKQRTMWGYKILFLDVLFPLGVNKVIFVDADQIVRADLRELRDLDLEGNPYGYTPFCDDRPDMDGFRFWKQGYWRGHLAGRKYHISAIYVIDLKKFRRIAAGDRLRGQYQGLSQDPNSLANLDQDLPNNMIHQVGIKSLPQEWLWCETWCSDASKDKAKTIDLCNNPKTKEPKLSAAVRIAPEWAEYDNEIKALLKKVEEQEILTETKEEKPKPAAEKNEAKHEEL